MRRSRLRDRWGRQAKPARTRPDASLEPAGTELAPLPHTRPMQCSEALAAVHRKTSAGGRRAVTAREYVMLRHEIPTTGPSMARMPSALGMARESHDERKSRSQVPVHLLSRSFRIDAARHVDRLTPGVRISWRGRCAPHGIRAESSLYVR